MGSPQSREGKVTMQVKRLVPGLVILGMGLGIIVLGLILTQRDPGGFMDLGPVVQGLLIGLAGLVVVVIGLIAMVISLVRAILRRRADRALKG